MWTSSSEMKMNCRSLLDKAIETAACNSARRRVIF